MWELTKLILPQGLLVQCDGFTSLTSLTMATEAVDAWQFPDCDSRLFFRRQVQYEDEDEDEDETRT